MNTKYTWGYLKNAILFKLDLSENELDEQSLNNMLNSFRVYTNEVITQVCSAIKPKYTFARIEVSPDKVNVPITIDESNGEFVSFGDDVNYKLCDGKKIELNDTMYEYHGYNQLIFYTPGVYYISYNARWFTVDAATKDSDELPAPKDILDCIPSYVASQCYQIDDQYKSSVYRNEYEMMLARIDNTHYMNTKTITIGGDW